MESPSSTTSTDLSASGPTVTEEASILLAVLRRVAGPADGVVPLHAPEFAGREAEYVQECIASTFVSSVGAFVTRFEEMLAETCGTAHAVAVVNGTAALQVALGLAGVLPGDEVLVPALTFVATANATAHCGAVPHFIDSDPITLGMSIPALAERLAWVAEDAGGGLRNRESGRRIAAIVPMHTYGHPVDMAPLLELAERYGLPVVEDAAESIGSSYRGRPMGSFGRLAILSFNGNKIVTTGGGGAILTDDPELARRAKHLTTTAKVPHRWEFVHDEVAWNYRLPNLNAALGCAQLERLPDFLARKRRVAYAYRDALAGQAAVRFVPEPPGSRSNYWLATVILERAYAAGGGDPGAGADRFALRDAVLGSVNDAGYQSRPAWRLNADLSMYRDCPRGPLEVARRLEASVLNVPSSPSLAGAGAG